MKIAFKPKTPPPWETAMLLRNSHAVLRSGQTEPSLWKGSTFLSLHHHWPALPASSWQVPTLSLMLTQASAQCTRRPCFHWRRILLQRCIYGAFNWLRESKLVGIIQNVTYLHKPILFSCVLNLFLWHWSNICMIKCVNVTHKANAVDNMILIAYCSRTKYPKFGVSNSNPCVMQCDFVGSQGGAQLGNSAQGWLCPESSDAIQCSGCSRGSQTILVTWLAPWPGRLWDWTPQTPLSPCSSWASPHSLSGKKVRVHTWKVRDPRQGTQSLYCRSPLKNFVWNHSVATDLYGLLLHHGFVHCWVHVTSWLWSVVRVYVSRASPENLLEILIWGFQKF